MSSLIFSSHVTSINGKEYDGIGNCLKDTMDYLGLDYIFVRNSMDGKLPSEVQNFQRGRLTKRTTLRVWGLPGPLRYILEYVRVVSFFSQGTKPTVYIGIDPLNALMAIRLKKKGRVGKAIFYTADYSPERFANPVLNWAYHAIDRYCVREADEVWSVSTRICTVRHNMGLDNKKNIFLPNVPPMKYSYLKSSKRDKYELITTGIIDKQMDYDGMIGVIYELKDEMPDLHLTIIGNGPEENRLKKIADELGVTDRVEFAGKLPLDKTLERIARGGVGLALYTGVWGFNMYGDSTKCREFFYFGLPVISTDSHSTVEEIMSSGSGIVTKPKVAGYVDAIRKIYKDYGKYSQSSYMLGEHYDGAHEKIIEMVLKDG